MRYKDNRGWWSLEAGWAPHHPVHHPHVGLVHLLQEHKGDDCVGSQPAHNNNNNNTDTKQAGVFFEMLMAQIGGSSQLFEWWLVV